MEKLTDLQKFEAVNACETLNQLADVIMLFANEDGQIQGRRRMFNAEKMATACKTFKDHNYPNALTREFGIRQQAMYIKYYT